MGDTTLTYEAFYNGLKGYYALKEKGILKQEGVLTIVDFTQHSSKERMYIINVNTFEIIKRLCVRMEKILELQWLQVFPIQMEVYKVV